MSSPAHPPPRSRIAFLGPPGTFTEEALLSQPDLAAGELVPVRQISDVITEVDQGRADLGVVPIENVDAQKIRSGADGLQEGNDLGRRARP